jgi:hypothetical protein
MWNSLRDSVVSQGVAGPQTKHLVENVQHLIWRIQSVHLIAVHFDNSVATLTKSCFIFECTSCYLYIHLTLRTVHIRRLEYILIHSLTTKDNHFTSFRDT